MIMYVQEVRWRLRKVVADPVEFAAHLHNGPGLTERGLSAEMNDSIGNESEFRCRV